MFMQRHKRFISAISTLCIFSLQLNAFAGWGETWDSIKNSTKKAASATADWASDAWDATSEAASDAWDGTKKAAVATANWTSDAWDASVNWTTNAWNATAEVASDVWDGTKKAAVATGDAVSSAGEWVGDHATEIGAVAVAIGLAVVTGGAISGSGTHSSSSPGYTYETSHATEGPYRPFTQSQKADIIRQNMERNGGVLRSDYSGQVLEMPHRYTSGYTPSPYEAQIDHIQPRSSGGWNSAENAQVLSREENLSKSDNLNWGK